MNAKNMSGLIAAWVCTLLAIPSSADPQGAIIHLHFQDTGQQRVVMAASQRGLVFIGEDLAPFRAFRSSALALEGRRDSFVWIQDIDSDRQEEYVFAGDPSFVLDQGADPYFGILNGCSDFFLGNTIDDTNPEIFCRNRNSLTVWNYDGQFLWEYSVTGMRLEECHAQDLDGDSYIEYACLVSTTDWLLIDIANAEPVQEVASNPAVDEMVTDRVSNWVREAQSTLSGEGTFDLDGDLIDQERLMFNAGVLRLVDSTGTTTASVDIPETTLYSVEVADLTGDGTPEIFLGGIDTIFVVSPAGERLASVQGNPNSLERRGRVSLASVGANGLEDSSAESAQAVIEGSMQQLHRCYNRQMGTDQFIRVGQVFYELTVNSSGRVDRTQRIHSSVQNQDLENCVEAVLEDMRFSPAAQERGTVSLRLMFDFTDR